MLSGGNAVFFSSSFLQFLYRLKEEEPGQQTDGDGRRDDGRWECFYYRFMWRGDWRGSVPSQGPSLRLVWALFLLSGARAGGLPRPKNRPKVSSLSFFSFFFLFFCEHTQTYFYNFILKYLFGWFWVALWIFPVFCSLFQRIKNEHGNKKRGEKTKRIQTEVLLAARRRRNNKHFPLDKTCRYLHPLGSPVNRLIPKKLTHFLCRRFREIIFGNVSRHQKWNFSLFQTAPPYSILSCLLLLHS